MDHPFPWLRYLDADDLDPSRAAGSSRGGAKGGDVGVEFDGMNVESASGEHLGTIDGFIVDSESGRPYYVVVDASGWFKTKHFLLPVGHAHLDANNEVLRAGLTRDRVERFPGFDRDEFDKLTVDDLKRFNDETCRACTIAGVAAVYSATESYSAAWDRPDFRQPDWWRQPVPHTDRATASARSPQAGTLPGSTSSFKRSEQEREAIVAQGETGAGRAQPGDVIGIETGGERTHVGETAEDEDKRRETAEKAVRDERDRRP